MGARRGTALRAIVVMASALALAACGREPTVIAVELGSDVIKADPCADLAEYGRVIEVASGCPVLVRGGSKAPEAELLQRTAAVIGQGAVGIVYGRNIIQHPAPAKIVKALMAVVHANASPDSALGLLA